MCIFVGHFGFLNFDLGGWGSKFVISDFVNFRLPNSTQIKLLLVFWSVIFGLAVRFAPGALLALPPSMYKVYNKLPNVYQNYKNVHSNLQFIDKKNLDTFIYQVIGGRVGSVVACR